MVKLRVILSFTLVLCWQFITLNANNTTLAPSFFTQKYQLLNELTSSYTIKGKVTNSREFACSGTTISSFPYSESFESGLGSWTQATNDDINWSERTGTTPSNDTGPESAAAGNDYLFTESSVDGTGYPDKVAILNSPCFNLSSVSTAQFDFQYSMYGDDMGTLYLQVSTNNGSSWTTLWNRSGDQGTGWNTATVSLNSYTGQSIQLRFRGVTGSGFHSDIAIDDLSLTTNGGGSTGGCSTTFEQNSPNVPRTISSTRVVTVTSTLNVSQSGLITDLNVSSLDISHTYISDLSVTLTSPSGTEVELFPETCGSTNNIRIRYDDDSPYSSIPCPPTNNQYYQPAEPLSTFNGEQMQGTWTLTIRDYFDEDGGQLNDWGLYFNIDCNGDEICDNGIDDDGDGFIDNADSDCLGGCSSQTFNFQNPSLISGSDGAENAVYRYSNVLFGTDALVRIYDKSHSSISIRNIDLPESAEGGYDYAFQPYIDYNFGSYGERWVEFELTFVEAGTSTRKAVPKITMSAVDVDGDDVGIREFFQANNFDSYKRQSSTNLTFSGSLKAKGNLDIQPGISENALQTMVSFDYINRDRIYFRYGADYDNFGNSGNITDDRWNCLFFKCYNFNFVENCPAITITGPNKICPNESVELRANTSNTAGSCTIQWQSSSNGTSWSNVNTGNTLSINNLSQSTYYRAAITCSGATYCGTVYSTEQYLKVVSCVEICDNGRDDDGDGQIDCADGDCGKPNIVAITQGNPSNCPDLDNGRIEINAIGSDLVYSINNGINYQSSNIFPGLSNGIFQVRVRNTTTGCDTISEIVLSDPGCIEICDNGIDDDGDGLIDCGDGDCAGYVPIELADDSFNNCPGFIIERNLSFNDRITYNSIYTLAQSPTEGVAIINKNGSFAYTSFLGDCQDDTFTYQVCDTITGCCEEATVLIDLTDSEAPALYNVPTDETIHCDEYISPPPLVYANDNCPEIAIELEELSTGGEDGCALYDYELTRIWTAIDQCGNQAIDSQEVSILDITAPDIYRIYTLPNGKKMVAGVMENVTHRWKTISLPIDFPTTPLIFSQVISEEDPAVVTTRVRNISISQFELKLQEEEANSTTPHAEEKVAWIAIEAGTEEVSNVMDVDLLSVNQNWSTVNFKKTFDTNPVILSNIQSVLESDPATIRFRSLNVSNIQFRINEETSSDGEDTHNNEWMAYWATEMTDTLRDMEDNPFGESGVINVNHNWTTVNTVHNYINPVVVATGLSYNDNTPAVVRIKNVASNSFEVSVQEWDYLDGTHATEQVNYIVVEGSIPLDASIMCQTGTDNLEIGKDIIAIDNCDVNVSLEYDEETILDGNAKKIIRSWFTQDECGNQTGYSQIVSCEGVGIKVKAMLQGAMLDNEETNLMRDDLREKGLIPLKDPYTSMAAFTHKGLGGNEEIEPGLLAITGNDAIVDWVFVELRKEENQEEVLATQSGLLQRDGDVIAQDGSDILYFDNLPPGNYFICLRHRNHLQALTLHPYFCNGSVIPTIDFTDQFLPTVGNKAFIDIGNKNALWSGDLNHDKKTIYQGPANDIFYMFLQVVMDSLNQNVLTNYINTGYTENDFNLDGITIYQGPNNDRANLLFNTILRHSDNPNKFTNFIISTNEKVVDNNSDCLDATKNFCDFDKDGKLNNTDPDDDNDGVIDGNDSDPFNENSDTDEDGLNDKLEKAKGTNPLNPCDPYQDHSLCHGIDEDGDGLYGNYPVSHSYYDINDQGACIPNSNGTNCDCPNEDGDGFITICHININGQQQTIQITLAEWRLRQAIGDICGKCPN